MGFLIPNFYIEQMKEEKAWRRDQAKLRELQTVQKNSKNLKFDEGFFYCEITQETSCKVSYFY